MSLAKPKGVRFSEDELARLKEGSAQLGISENDLIRKLVDKGLEVLEREGFDLNLAKTQFIRSPRSAKATHTGGGPGNDKTKQAVA